MRRAFSRRKLRASLQRRTANSAINEAKKDQPDGPKKHISLQADGEAGLLDIEVFPIRSVANADRCFLILFEEVEAHKIKLNIVPTGRGRSKLVGGSETAHLKAQLGVSQDALRDAIEAHEGADVALGQRGGALRE